MGLFRSSFSRLPRHKTFDYQPRHYDPDKESRDQEKDLRLEKGAFYKNGNSRLVGAFTDRTHHLNGRHAKSNQNMRMVLLMGMLSIPWLYWLEIIGGIITFVGLIILLVLFIIRANKI